MKITGISTVYDGRFTKMKIATYENENGQEGKWEYATRVGGRKAVVIVAMEKAEHSTPRPLGGFEFNNKLIITKEFRVPIMGYEWGFPAGLIDDGETPEETAVREFKEETGMDLIKINRVSPFVYNSPGITDESIAIVYGEATGEISQAGNEASEDIFTVKADAEYIKTLMSDPTKMIGAKAWQNFERFVAHGDV